MKRLQIVVLLSLIILGASVTGCEQTRIQKSIPQAVLDRFESDYPDARKVEWEVENDLYEVEFKNQGKEIEITYDELAQILQMEEEIEVSELPQAVQSYIDANYSGASIDEAERSTLGETVEYEVEIDSGGSELELVFDANGQFLYLSEDD